MSSHLIDFQLMPGHIPGARQPPTFFPFCSYKWLASRFPWNIILHLVQNLASLLTTSASVAFNILIVIVVIIMINQHWRTHSFNERRGRNERRKKRRMKKDDDDGKILLYFWYCHIIPNGPNVFSTLSNTEYLSLSASLLQFQLW